MLNRESIEKVLEGLNLSKVDLKIYTDTFETIWKIFKPVYDTVDDSHNGKHIYHVFRRCMEMVKWLKFNTRNFNEDKESRFILKLGLAAMTHDAFSLTYRKNHHDKAHEFIRKIVDLKVIEGNHIDPLTKVENMINAEEDVLTFLYKQKDNDFSSYLTFEDGVMTHEGNYIKENHKYLYTILQCFSKYDLLEVSDMVQQHRASYEGNFTSELCEIFSAADRDDLDLSVIINRIYTCALNDTNKFACAINGYKELILCTNSGPVSLLSILKNLEKEGWSEKHIKTFYHLCEKFSRDGYAYKNLKADGFYKTYYSNKLLDFWDEIYKIIFIPSSMLKYIKK